MLKQLYMRPVDRKAACRRHLFPQSRDITTPQQTRERVCLAIRCNWLPVELVRCSLCSSGECCLKGSVHVCPLPTKETAASLASSSGSSVPRSSTFDTFPELWAFLTCYQCPDGSKRQGGKLSLSCERGLWSLALNDPSTSLYACLNAPSLDDLVLMVEARLAESTMPWRPSNYSPKGRR